LGGEFFAGGLADLGVLSAGYQLSAFSFQLSAISFQPACFWS
jgi:hypothetical protein